MTQSKKEEVLIEKIRQAFADYRFSEGCSCCRDIEAHEKAEQRLAKLLQADPYDDHSGWDWSKYRTKNSLNTSKQ